MSRESAKRRKPSYENTESRHQIYHPHARAITQTALSPFAFLEKTRRTTWSMDTTPEMNFIYFSEDFGWQPGEIYMLYEIYSAQVCWRFYECIYSEFFT
jgi:hypothetical protein